MRHVPGTRPSTQDGRVPGTWHMRSEFHCEQRTDHRKFGEHRGGKKGQKLSRRAAPRRSSPDPGAGPTPGTTPVACRVTPTSLGWTSKPPKRPFIGQVTPNCYCSASCNQGSLLSVAVALVLAHLTALAASLPRVGMSPSPLHPYCLYIFQAPLLPRRLWPLHIVLQGTLGCMHPLIP